MTSQLQVVQVRGLLTAGLGVNGLNWLHFLYSSEIDEKNQLSKADKRAHYCLFTEQLVTKSTYQELQNFVLHHHWFQGCHLSCNTTYICKKASSVGLGQLLFVVGPLPFDLHGTLL